MSAARASAVAAVDCGTNSTRLLVAGGDGSTIDRRMRITRLGEGVDRTGRLQGAAIRRTLDVLAEYHEAMAEAGVVRILAVATSAIRDSANAEDFLGPAGEILGAELAVLPGDEEGRLSYRGATADLPSDCGPYLVVDVGGGSTELVTAGSRPGGGIEAMSLDIGCVRVTERFLAADPPTGAQLAEAAAFATQMISVAGDANPAFASARTLVGLAGTVSALTMLALGLEVYDRSAVHHAHLPRAQVRRLLGELASVDVTTRRGRAGMEHDRADVIVGGAIVLLSVMEVLGFDDLTVSEADILDGIVAQLLEG
jgi:exopolyphosphatase/guanosine-5'-triphosphate,3'-diphosphate pyrophosphatase